MPTDLYYDYFNQTTYWWCQTCADEWAKVCRLAEVRVPRLIAGGAA